MDSQFVLKHTLVGHTGVGLPGIARIYARIIVSVIDDLVRV